MALMHVVTMILSWVMIIAILLPFVRNDYWVFRILEYPRFQKFIISLAILALTVVIIPLHDFSFETITAGLLAAGILYLGYKILPYTALYKKEMLSIPLKQPGCQLRIFTANVYQENTDYDKMLQQVRSTDPDIVFLLETDKGWERAMDALCESYPYTIKEPLDNTYGLLLYSKLELTQGKVHYLVTPDVPSVEAIVQLECGQPVKIFGLHPKPPVPGEDDTSTDKDKELIKVAYKAKACTLPVIVMGDLNDVAWSRVTELFRKISGLLDPRRGRGFYSTFSAFHPFFRFPLDYVFCSSHFGLVTMKRLPKNGSDHFAIFSELQFAKELRAVQEEPSADKEEHDEAQEKLAQNSHAA